MNLKEALIYGISTLKKSENSPNPDLDTRILICHALNCTLEEMLSKYNYELGVKEKIKFSNLIERRTKGEPIAYLVGKKDFWKSEFVVTPDVLIPRPDTETLIEEILSDYDKDENLDILELGVGSGAIILSLLLELKNATGVGLDISLEALQVCNKNTFLLHLEDRFELYHSVWYGSLPAQKFDIIVSNPPYISLLDPLVDRVATAFEPSLALYAKDAGYDGHYEIVSKASNYLKDGGQIYLEIGHKQAGGVTRLLSKFNFEQVRVIKDVSGNDRVVTAIYS